MLKAPEGTVDTELGLGDSLGKRGCTGCEWVAESCCGEEGGLPVWVPATGNIRVLSSDDFEHT